MEKHELLSAITETERLDQGGVKLKIHTMNYPFCIYQLFGSPERKESDYESFCTYVFEIAFEYMKKWMFDHRDDKENKQEQNLHHLFNFCHDQSSKLREIFEAVYDPSKFNIGSLVIPIGNLALRMKRFGDSLGLQLMSNNGHGEVHGEGTRIFTELSNGNVGFFQYVSEFIHSVECTISLPRKYGENNSVGVDLFKIFDELQIACPYIDWAAKSDVTETLTEYYEIPINGMVLVGKSKKGELAISAQLVHFSNPETKEAPQWRRGNIQKEADGVYKFYAGQDICLSLCVESPFPQRTYVKEISLEIELGKLQSDLRKVGASMYAQLCVMQTNKH